MSVNFDILNDYEPQKVTDGFEIIKGSYICQFNYARIEEYSGDKEEFQGTTWFNYELEIVSGPNYTGRKLWKRYNLDDEKKLKQLADMMFTLGFEFKNAEELEKAAEQLVRKTVKVKCWGWKIDKNEDSEIQMHLIKGFEDAASKADDAPF